MITRIVLTSISAYQYCLSALLGPRCRFYPSCSQYTKEAVESHGLMQGLLLGSKRIARCHPWHEGGYDPVPESSAVADDSNNQSRN